MGHVVGGHQRLVDAIVAAASSHGATFETGAAGRGSRSHRRRRDRRRSGWRGAPLRSHVVTLQPPALRFLLPDALAGLMDPYPRRYLGVVCLVLKTRASLSPYYSVNICEPTPITTVVETSHVVGTDHTDGLRLVYVPRYCDPDAPDQTEPDQSIYDRYTAQVARVLPSFSHDDVVGWTVQRARLVEPVHELGSRLAPIWPDRPRSRPRVERPDLPLAAQRELGHGVCRARRRGRGHPTRALRLVALYAYVWVPARVCRKPTAGSRRTREVRAAGSRSPGRARWEHRVRRPRDAAGAGRARE